MFLPHLIHVTLLNKIVLLSQELVDGLRGATASYQSVTVWQSDGSSIVEKFVVWLINRLYLPILVMQIEHDDLVGVTKEAKLLICHFYGAMVYTCHVFDAHLEFLGVELNLRVCHLNRLECVSLLSQRFFLILEVLNPVGKITAFDLLTTEIVNLLARFRHVLPAEPNQAQVLVKVFLLSHNSCLFNLERFSVLKFDFGPFLQDHMDDSVEVFVNLCHDLYLALFDLLTQLRALADKELGPATQRLQILNYLGSVFLQDVN